MNDLSEADSDSARHLGAGLEAGQVGVWRWDMVSGRLFWSPNLEAIHDLPPGQFDGTFAYFETDIHPDDSARVRATIEEALSKRTSYHVEYRLPDKPGAPERWLEARGGMIWRDGEVVGMTGVCQDITERKRSETELALRARQQEIIAKLGRMALSDISEQDFLDTVMAEMEAVLDVEFCKILELAPGGTELLLRAGRGWNDGLVGRMRLDIHRGSQAGYTLRADHAVVTEDMAHESRFSGGELLGAHKVVSGVSAVIVGDDGRPFGVLGVHTRRRRRFLQTDIDFVQSVANIIAAAMQRVRVGERQQLLIRELRHRVGNLLSMILSLFNNTVGSTESIEELKEKFQARVISLSRAHSLVSQGGWRSASLSGLIDEVLAPYRDRIDTEGEDVVLSADGAFALGLALHELATNAVKYGALSLPEGRLGLSWSLERDDDRQLLALEWRERGGPEVKAPQRRGFGTKLVSAVVQSQLNGTFVADFAPSGLRVDMRLPLGDS